MQANSAVDRELRHEALEDLCIRVDDWKQHKVDHFGDLLLHGHFPVVTGKSEQQKEVRPRSAITDSNSTLKVFRAAVSSKRKALSLGHISDFLGLKSKESRETSSHPFFLAPDDQRHWDEERSDASFINGMVFYHPECINPITRKQFSPQDYTDKMGITPNSEQYTIYLFERILLCCTDGTSKSKDKLMGVQKDKKDKKDKRNKENKTGKLQLKGRIFMANVTEVVSLGKQGTWFFPIVSGLSNNIRFIHSSDILERRPWS